MKKRYLALLLVFTLCIGLLSGCGKKPTDVVMKVGNYEMTREEFLYHIAYFEVYGINDATAAGQTPEEFWKAVNADGQTNRNTYYTMAFAEATYYMIMAGVAVDIGNMSLTESEETGAENYAKEYYELFTENEKKRSGMTLHGFELAIKRIVLANKYIAFLKDGITVDEEQLRAENKPEDYTCISTEWISVKKTAENAHLAIEKALEKMQSGSSAEETAKFLSSMTEFSTGTRHVNAGNNVEELYLNAVKNADEKGLSGIIEGENVYYVVKVLDKNCNSYYEDRIAHLVDDMKEEALDNYYEQIAFTYTRTIKDTVVKAEQFGNFCNDEKN